METIGTNGEGSWYSVTEALEKLGISRRTLYDRIKKQYLTTKKIGKNRLVWLDGTEEIFTSQHTIRTNTHNIQAQEHLEEQLFYFKNKVVDLENELKEQRVEAVEERKRHDTIIARITEQNQMLLQSARKPFWKFW